MKSLNLFKLLLLLTFYISVKAEGILTIYNNNNNNNNNFIITKLLKFFLIF